jgi:predicted transport protein
MEESLVEKTGKSLDQWIDILQNSGLEKHKEMMELLQSGHNLSYGFANFIALKARKSDAASFEADTLVENQYQGKDDLKQIYELLLIEIKQFGDDITITTKKDSVSIIRKRQFALIKPASKTRIDLGLKFKNKPTGERLGNSGPFGAMCTHRVQIASVENIDPELLGWLKEAYNESV